MNRHIEQKRSSLDLSESSSDNEDPRQESYGYKNDRAESYNSQEDQYSPDVNSMEDSYKPTPKSILKDNVSALKGNKNIHINETLNETHPISHKEPNSNLSPDYQGYTNDKYRGDSSPSAEDQSPGKYGSSDDDRDYEARLRSKYGQDDYGKGVSGFKNRLVVGQGATDFQRAHIRKLQQEREQELSYKGVRESAEAVREKWQAEKARRSVDAEENLKDEQSGREEYEKEGDRERLDRIDEEEDRDYEKKKKNKGKDGGDTGKKFERIKNKVSNLEKELHSYSKDLKKDVLKQEDRNQNLSKVYGDFEEKMKEAKDELDQSLKGKKREVEEGEQGYGSRGFSADRNRKEKTGEHQGKSSTKKGKRTSSVTKGSKKSIETTNTGIPRGASTTFKKLQEEIAKLRYQNEMLKGRLDEDEENEKTRNRRTVQSGPDIDREKELIDTIERIKGKLRKSIAKKMHDEKQEQIFEVKQEGAAQSFGRTYQAPAVDHKNILMRKTYGDTTLTNKENLLYKGRGSRGSAASGTSYSQKLNKSKR